MYTVTPLLYKEETNSTNFLKPKELKGANYKTGTHYRHGGKNEMYYVYVISMFL